MDLHIDVDLQAIPREFERDEETGEVTAYNDDLRVMAVGADKAEASARFEQSVAALAQHEIAQGRKLPDVIQRWVYA
jgi:hypothetical protein